ncbi:MAG: site-specific integrase [Chlorobium sp.]|nr:site-specific integrase [Chlorobium sp.]
MSAKVVEKPKGSGKWGVRICKNELQKYQRTSTKAEAERLAKMINTQLARVDLGLVPAAPKILPTFAQYTAIWLETYIKPPMRSQRTYSKYRGLLDNYLIPAIGKKTLEIFRRATIRDTLLNIYNSDKKPSRSLLDTMIAVLSGVFAFAVDSELISVNPVADIGRSLRLPREMKKKVEPFTGDESEAILATLEGCSPAYYPLFLTLFTTGMRVGEACGLQWNDVNFKDRIITVQRTTTHQTVHNTTKTHAARMVDMSKGLSEMLKKLRSSTEEEELAAGVNRPYCFHKAGALLAHSTLRRVFGKALSVAAVNTRRIHDIRHTYASRLLSAGESIVYVSRQLGHKNIQMTVDIYTHWIPSGEERPSDMLDRTS